MFIKSKVVVNWFKKNNIYLLKKSMILYYGRNFILILLTPSSETH